MVARKNDSELADRRRKEIALELQREVQQKFLLEQLEELSVDFADDPEQLANYLADLEASGMLTPADKGLVFRRLWETMGPSFADRAFGMTSRALASSEDLASDIAEDAYVNILGDRAIFSDEAEYARVREAANALTALASALGLKLDVPRPELRRKQQFDNIKDPDAERAAKTAEVLDSLGRKLGVDSNRVDVRVDEVASERTADAGIWGLMSEGTVYLDPEIYDPETTAGKHLLAHEMIHVAQLENRLRGANDTPDLFAAEAEADTLSATFAATGELQAPLTTLAAYDAAACGPREMNKDPDPEPPRNPRKEVEREDGKEETKERIEEITLKGDVYFRVGTAIGVGDHPTRGYSMEFGLSHNKNVMQSVAAKMKAHSEIKKVLAVGHASTTGNYDWNKPLSERRARHTRDTMLSTYGVPGEKLDTTFLGETEHRKAMGINDDKTQREDVRYRRVTFFITEAEGDFNKDTQTIKKVHKDVVKKPGRTIIRYYDENNKLIRTEILVDGETTPQVIEPEADQGAPETPATADNQTTTPPASTTAPGGGTPSGPATTPTGPAGGQTQPARPPATDTLRFRRKIKNNRRKQARAPRRFADNALRTVAQPKAGPGGITSTQMDHSTRSSGGEPIPESIRGQFESAFGQSFADVRIHRGSTQATGIGATAFARGTDIHFAPGRFDPDSSSGLAVLGHELTHIVQQRAGRVAIPQGMGTHVNVDRALEAEADLLGSRAARGESVQVQGSSAGLYARAASGAADTIQYEGGAGAQTTGTEGGARPTHCELRIGGQRIRARMPSTPATPGEVRVDFSEVASIPGLQLKTARVTFNANWEIERGELMADVAVGQYVKAENVTLSITQKSDSTGKYAEVAAEVRGAQFKIDGLFDSTIDLRISNRGVTGRAAIQATAPITLGQGITLTGGTLNLELREGGGLGASGRLTGTVAAGGVNLNVEITADAMNEGHIGGGVRISLAAPVPVPGVEGVTIKSGTIAGRYVHGQQWSVEGGLTVNVRDCVEASITGKYTQQASTGGNGGEGQATSSWELTGTLRQLQPYQVPGTGEEPLTLSKGQLDLHFKDGKFLKVEAKADWDTTNFKGNVSGTFDVQQTKLDAKGTVNLKPPELPVGTTGIKFTQIKASVTLKANELEKVEGNLTAIFPYQEQPTFKVDGANITYVVKDKKLSGTTTVSTLRPLDFGDKAAYNATVKQGATGQLVLQDNKLVGITGGLAFDVQHGASKIGNGSVDVNFVGETSKLNATAKFTLTAPEGFGVPDRVNGPVKLLPGGQFQLTIEDSKLGAATLRGVKFAIKQEGEGATGRIEGIFNGNYNFQTSKLTTTGNAVLKGNWPLAPVDGVRLTFKEGGRVDVAVNDNKITNVSGNFPYELVIGAKGSVPEIKIEGGLNGRYSDESKKFNGQLNGALKNNVDIPVNEDKITIKAGSTFKATVADSAPGSFEVGFACDYTRKGQLFLSGNVAKASYDFKKGHFGFKGDLTLKAKIEKQTEDGKWKFVVNPGTQVGVEVAESQLKLVTGRINFEVHDTEGALLKGSLTDAKVEVAKLEFSGKLTVALARDMRYPRSPSGTEEAPKGSPPVQAVAKKDVSQVWGTVSKNQLTEIGAKLIFGVNLGGAEYGAGELTGKLDMKGFQFDGTGKINLIKDLIVGGNERNSSGDPIASWILAFPAGQGLDLKITKNQLDEANINLNGKLLHNFEEVANGAVTGRYKLGETKGFQGEINANVIKDLDWSKDARFHYWVETGTTAKVVITNSAVESAKGNFSLRMNEIPQGNRPAVRVTFNGAYVKGSGFAAEAGINVLNDVLVGQGGEFKFAIGQGSQGNASVKGAKIERFYGNLLLDVKRGPQAFAKGQFNLDYKHTDANAKVNAEGTVELLARTDVSPQGAGEWKFFLMPATGVTFKVANSELDYVKGQINVASSFKGVDCITGQVDANYTHRPRPEFSAKGNITVTSNIQLGQLPGGYKVIIEPSTGATFDVTKNELKEVGGVVKVRLDDRAPLARVELRGTYKHSPEKRVDGRGRVELLRKVEVGRSTDGKYQFNILAGTGADATLDNSKLTQIKGQLVANVQDESEFARFDGNVEANKVGEAWKITAQGVSLKVNRDKDFDVRGGWKITLCKGTNASVTIRDNNLESISGAIVVRADKGETFSGKVTLQGEYTPGGGFNGNGKAELLKDFNAGGKAPYAFVALKGGTEATINVAASAVTRVGGKINFKVTENAKDFVTGNASVDYDVAKGQLVEAKGNGRLAMDKQMGTYSGFTLVAVQGSNAEFLAQNGELMKIGGQLNLRVDEKGSELAKGTVKAEFDVKNSKFSGSAEVFLTRDYVVSANGRNGRGQPESWGLAIKSQSKLALSIKENVFETAHINVNAVAYHNGMPKADGKIVADYKVGDPDGVTGQVELNVTQRIPLLEGSGRFDYHIDTGTKFNGEVVKGSIKSASGTFKLAATETAKDKVHVTVSATYTAGKGVDGSGTIKVVDPILIKEGGQWKLFLDAGSGGNASFKGSKLEEISGTLKLRVDKGAEKFATGDFTASYKVSDGKNAQVSATGRVTLIGRVNVTPGGGTDFKVWLTGGSNIGASIKNGELEYVDGQIKGDLDWKGASLARFDVQGKYQATGVVDFSGTGKLETIKAVQVTEFGGYQLFLGVGANITGSVKAFALDELTAGIPLSLRKAGGEVVKAKLEGRYKHAERKFDGTGTADVVKQITIAEGVGAKGYSFYLMPSSGVSAEIKGNALKKVEGKLVVHISDTRGEAGTFLKASAQATYEGGEAPNVTANGKLEVTRPKEMLTTRSGYAIVLQKGSGATVVVTKNELNEIGGTVNIDVNKKGALFAKIALAGRYTPATGFDGKGTAELCQEWEVNSTKIGNDNYSVWVVKGTGAEITLQTSEIKHIGGTVNGMIRDAPGASGNFIKVEAKANYDFPAKNFSGSGAITVLKEKKLATFSGEELWLAKGSGASGSIVNNNLQRVDGSLNLQLRDSKGHWLTCALKGGFDASGGTGFSGKGTVTVHKDKQLAELAGYKFVLAAGAGASATIDQNKLTEVTGQVPFKVYDNQSAPLIEGKAEGVYKSVDKKFSGSGSIYLGRDVEFPIGGGKLVFKKGSGGGGKVVNNELNELTGTLKVDVWDAKGPMVGLAANGKFNAVTKKLERVEGTAKLLRAISIGGEGDQAFLRIDSLSGSALVENNELKKIEGSLGITLPRLNNMKGQFSGGWQKTASDDLFWGKGWIEFTLFKDPAKGREVSGKVEGEYRKDRTFTIKGEVDYKLNPMIGGKLGVEVDQNLDPKLSGTLNVTNVTLVQGRDLFKWSKDFNLLRTTIAAGPVPIAMSGGVGVGLGLSMRPLTFNASIGVSNFRPLSAKAQVPDFSAKAELSTGLRFAAALKPWFSIGVGVAGVASAGLALQGEAGVNVDVNVSPFAELKGQGGVYSGNLGIGLEIVGSGHLALTPQIYAELIGKKWPYNLTEIRHDLGKLFSYSYNFGVPFGDQPAAPREGGGGPAKQTAAAGQTTKIAGHKTPPPKDPATTGAPQRPGPVKGGPDLNQANTDSKESSKRDGPMGELMSKIDRIQEWAAKVGAVANVGGTLVSMLMFMVTIPPPFGIAVAGGYLAYKIISGSLKWDTIVTAAKTVWELISSIDLSGITKLLPEWLVNLWNKIKGKSLDQLLVDMINTMRDWLNERFPSARRVITALANVATTVIQTIARVIRNILSGNFGLNDFLDICRSVGGAVLQAVLALVGDAVVDGVKAAGRAVGNFVRSLW